MKYVNLISLSLLLGLLMSCGRYEAGDTISEPPAVELSKQLLEGLKAGENVDSILQQLANLEPQALKAELNTREEQLAFWVNIYNGMVQHLLITQPELWEKRNSFFSTDRITVAGKLMSPELIEHGIIRGGEAKLGLGLVPKFFTNKFERSFKIKGGDPRVHFALNCGAIDCPPIEIYDPKNLNERLDYRSRVYLEKHTVIDEAEEEFTTTPLVSWFRGDFATYGGVNDFFVHFGILSEQQQGFSRSHKDYDWTLATGVYAED
ncbi:MAG: DUF547 domain-containing protein [Bacteroidota bacterium]